MTKAWPGNYFEDFAVGQEIVHGTPRTVTEGDIALYVALTGSRFALQSATTFAQSVGLAAAPVDDLLVFHIVFGKTVPEISLNAVANLGYAECRFLARVQAGDTLSTTSTVIGVKENSNKQTGTVWVRSTGVNQRDEVVLDYVRWVMVRKRDEASPAPEATVPKLEAALKPAELFVPPGFAPAGFDAALSASPHRWGDYAAGEKIDHVDGMTIEEAEHAMATRLYQNTAKVHFNQFTEARGRFGRRLIYGGHIISLARAHSFNGLGNAWLLAGINAGRHAAPTFAGDTIFAWTEVLERAELPGRADVGALRLRTYATKNLPCAEHPASGDQVVLDLDYWALLPR
ncbi:MaoC family dehydratase [Zavarzinia sp. CC-PAN008]|uniref:MaoC family dehydratase n=1 Tax=Zavarzinia sp. CC-PAN008 TaxID=3243332 RepID=UPI003F743D6C